MIGVKSKAKGPLFERKNIIREGVRGAVQATLDATANRLSDKLVSQPRGVFLSRAEATSKGHKPSTGHYRRMTGKTKRMLSDYTGMISDGGVVYGPWLEGTSNRNKGRWPGYATFRMTAQHIEKRLKTIIAIPVNKMIQKMR